MEPSGGITRTIKRVVKKEKEPGLTGIDERYLSPHFFIALCGKPGSGKSTVMSEMILNDQLYGKKFDHVFMFGPTKLPGVTCDVGSNYFPTYSPGMIYSCIKWAAEKKAKHVLVCLDDVVGALKKDQHSKELMDLFFNRRHILPEPGVVSFLVTSQKYKTIPFNLRSVLTGVISWKPQRNDWRHIKEECIMGEMDNPMIERIIFKHWGEDPHNFVYFKLDNNQIILNWEKNL